MPHQVCHAHCPKGGGGLLAVVLVVAAVIIAASARAIEHAAEVVLEVAVITVASVLGLAALGVVAYVALRIHRSHARNRQAITQHAPVAQLAVEAVSAPHRLAIEAPKAALADLKAMAAEHGYDVIRHDGED
jgi:hypothetical protein